MTTHLLPPQLHVFVRDWLSANNILLKGRHENVLVDSGHVSHVPLTLSLLATHRGLDGAPLAQVVNTHCHSDHMGGNAAIVRRYGCSIAVPEGEAPLIARWDETALLLAYADQTAERFTVNETLLPGATYSWGDLEWQALAAPGHAMKALVFYNPEHAILISGDALWRHGFGLVMPPAFDADALPATRATLEMLAGLDIRVVIPGHGEPFTDVDAALERAMERLAAFEADQVRMARYALKALLMFRLLHQRRLALSGLPDYVDRIGIYRDFNAAFFHLAPADLAQMLTADLERAGVVHRSDGWLLPA